MSLKTLCVAFDIKKYTSFFQFEIVVFDFEAGCAVKKIQPGAVARSLGMQATPKLTPPPSYTFFCKDLVMNIFQGSIFLFI